MKKYIGLLALFLSGCAYHNPLDEADFRFQTLTVPPYVLSSWYRIDQPGKPLTVYVEKEDDSFEGIENIINTLILLNNINFYSFIFDYLQYN